MSRLYWLTIGVAFGTALGVVFVHASDPCDKNYDQRWERSQPDSDDDEGMHKSYDPNGNAVWTLHPR